MAEVDAPFPAQVTEAGIIMSCHSVVNVPVCFLHAGACQRFIMFMLKSQVKVKVGDLVDAGGVLAVLSAMKMLNDP